MSVQNSRNPEKQKFRDSCNSCAVAKVKCSKAKPVCSRCEDRNLICCYSPSHRLGRRPASASIPGSRSSSHKGTRCRSMISVTTSASVGSSTSASMSTSEPATSSTSNTTTPRAFSAPTDFSAAPSPSINPDLTFSNALWQLSPFPTPGEDLNSDFFASGMNFPSSTSGQAYEQWLATCDHDRDLTPTLSDMITPLSSYGSSVGDRDFASSVSGIITPLSSCGSYGNFNSYFNSNSVSKSVLSLPDFGGGTAAMEECSGFTDWDSRCGQDANCLSLAMSLLARQHSIGSVAPTLFNATGVGRKPPINEVIATNKSTLETAMAILKCSCHSSNDHIAVLVALVTLKVISWYAVVAQEDDSMSNEPISTASNQASTSITQYCLDSNDCGPIRAQIVLGELHRVVRLVQVLSERFNKEKQRHESALIEGEVSMSGTGEDEAGQIAESISGSVLTSLLDSLKERLQVVTKSTMAMIRES